MQYSDSWRLAASSNTSSSKVCVDPGSLLRQRILDAVLDDLLAVVQRERRGEGAGGHVVPWERDSTRMNQDGQDRNVGRVSCVQNLLLQSRRKRKGCH